MTGASWEAILASSEDQAVEELLELLSSSGFRTSVRIRNGRAMFGLPPSGSGHGWNVLVSPMSD